MIISILVATKIIFLIIAGEMVARYVLGLGTPPLSIPHPTIEYMFAPHQDVQRFGNRILINEVGMRNGPLEAKRPGESRFLVIGDSVLNGGSLTDHSKLATTLLSNDDVLYLNASAGSWGPQNMVSYLREFGTFDADMIITVLSSHDAADVPDFSPLNEMTHPTRTPPLALWEGLLRYLPQYLPRWDGPEAAAGEGDDIEISREAIAAVEDFSNFGLPVCLVLHRTRHEIGMDQPGLGYSTIRDAGAWTTVVHTRRFISSPDTAYRDDIHLTEDGQRDLAAAILKCRNGSD